MIQPEGKEDLAIYDSAGSLIEIVQVKDHSDNLTVSSFKPSFYERIAPYCDAGSSTIVRIVSYGPIGPDLQNANSGQEGALSRVLKTLTTYRTPEQKRPDCEREKKKKRSKEKQKQKGKEKEKDKVSELAEAEARKIINHITLTSVVEEILTDAIIADLSKTVTGVSPRQAFEFMMWWLLTSSEVTLRIDRSKAIAKIASIGKFLSQRAAFHDEWHTSIVPISTSEGTSCINSLTDEFYKGGRVRFDHIDLDLDVPRAHYLKRIHDSFDDNSVVIIHSASGQGKTTLAYRYAKEFAALDFRFEVLATSDLKHARRIALALTGHAEAIEVPTLILLDVRPGDNYWVEVIRELASVDGIQALVAIREEDWTRARINAADFKYAEVQLSLARDEAEALYTRLTANIGTSRHLDFEDAWSQFGARKTLFEFVYFITQEESLAERITSQIKELQDAVIKGERGKGELELLRLVSVASAYEARLSLRELLDACNLDCPARTIELFNDEYLIRVSEDGSNVEGYHSIRSKIIAGELTDPTIHPWSESAARILPLIVEEDLHDFLLCAFSRNQNATKTLLAALDEFAPKTWIGVNGVAMSMMWNGVKEYCALNSFLVDEVLEQFNSAWFYVLDWDLAQVTGKNGINTYEEMAQIVPAFASEAEYTRSARARQSDKDAIFSDMRRWLQRCTKLPIQPQSTRSFDALAELSLWLGHLQIRSSLCHAITSDLIDKACEKLPLYLFGEFIRGIRTCANEVYCDWLERHRDELLIQLRQKASIVSLEETDEALVAHFIIDLDRQSSVLRSKGNSTDASATIHDLTMQRVELLNNLFPGKKQYGAIGYGHRMSLFAPPYDDASKPGVYTEYLHPRCLTRFNALCRGYAELSYRPDSWSDYFRRLQSIRESVLAALKDLRQSISSRRNNSQSASFISLKGETEWEECYRELRKPFLLPKVAVDEWGFVTESSTASLTDSRAERFSGLTRFNPLGDAVLNYTSKVSTFMSQAPHCLILVPLLQAAKSQKEKEMLMETAPSLGINANKIGLSIDNGIDACAAIEQLQTVTRKVFKNEGLPGADQNFLEHERKEFNSIMAAWCLFIDADARNQVFSKSKQSPWSLWRKRNDVGDLTSLLVSTKHRLNNALKSLQKHGIIAQIHSEKVLWNGMPALWITYDTIHPIASLSAVEMIWNVMIHALAPDRQSTVTLKAIDLLWSSIILVPLVAGKSVERHCFPHFKGVSYIDPPSLQQSQWRLSSEKITEDTWTNLGLAHWNVQTSWTVFDRFAAAYGELVYHVEHIADFLRIPGDIDELGVSIFQSYLDYEVKRVQPYAQKVFDTCSDVLKLLPTEIEVFVSRPNICTCIYFLVQMKDAIMPTHDSTGHFKLSINEVVEWRDRLVVGLQQLTIARQLWIADSLNFGAPPGNLGDDE
ncbi:MAG: hypothetical protein AB7W16_23040 [Candidatus Obscuribacterales bacterium]